MIIAHGCLLRHEPEHVSMQGLQGPSKIGLYMPPVQMCSGFTQKKVQQHPKQLDCS